VCDALVYLHSNVPPIIHRDIKPGNIKITSSGLAMLVDFGVAKEYRPDTKTTLGARAVTPGYSPVEQYGNGTTDQRSDQYALGATIYTLLTGRMPPESISRVTGAVLPLPRQINPAISAHVERAILRAMAILASDRFPSVADLREALKKSLASSAPADGAVQARRFPAMPPGFKAGALSDAPAQLKDASLSSPSGLPVSMPVSRPITIKPLPPSRRSAVRVEWVAIPDGEFILGEERKKIHLPAFEMARFPVTNLQYKVFLDAHPKYPAPAHWKDRNIPLGRQRHPVTGVSFFDAQAFCKWLGYRLPSEEEWEKAARGAEWRIYPWGDDWRDGKYCNNRDAHIGSTTPIDRYPDGASVYGVWDLAGNVWEWTSTENQGPNMHILKGGSWREYSGLSVQIGRRRFLTLGDKQDDTGFRCVRLL
jgi:serine/threonine-protein kinase